MKDTIIHTIPPNRPYFWTALPQSFLTKPLDEEGPEITVQDPRSGETVQVQVMEMSKMSLEEFIAHNAFCLGEYYITADKAAYALQKKYDEIRETKIIKWVLLKKL
jgi:hypothetical protein